jgi:cell wall-associated NlpC family hydrolase
MRIATAHRSIPGVLSTVVLCAALSMSSLAGAAPSTPEIEAKRAAAASAEAELARMNDELEIRVEEYNAITEALEQTRAQIRETEILIETSRRELTAARDQLAGRATSIYKDGGTGLLDVFLGTTSFQDFLVRVDLAVRINRQDAALVASVKDAKARVEAAERALETRESEQIALRGQADARRSQIEAAVDDQEAYVAALDSEIKRLVAEERERQRLLAEERARQAAAAAAAYAATGRTSADPSELGPGHPEVVPIGLSFLGVPYVWGGASPTGFDCSGLCQYVYAQIGVALPRTSRSQYTAGQNIARDRLDLLMPGDLVFFGTDGDAGRIHHVGIYVGDGNYLHAPEQGDVVRVSSLVERIERRSDYVGASRL